jgi:hypothetical protein
MVENIWTKLRRVLPFVAVLLFSIFVSAQAPVYHNGDVIRVSVAFDGPDAARIEAIAFAAEMGVQPDTSQAGFQNSFFCDQSKSKKTAPNTFECSFTIPGTQASGEYTLSQIRGYAHVGDQIQLFWGSAADFPKKMLRIENSNKFLKPSIKDVTIP